MKEELTNLWASVTIYFGKKEHNYINNLSWAAQSPKRLEVLVHESNNLRIESKLKTTTKDVKIRHVDMIT